MKFENKYLIHYYDIDNDESASIITLMRFFEDIAVMQSETLNLGLKYYEENNVGWFLYRWDINVVRYPKYNETIKLVTEPKAMKGFYANRDYFVYDETENLICTAFTLWLYVDTKTMRPKRIDDIMGEKFGPMPLENNVEKLETVEQLSTVQIKKEFDIRLTDIDTNKHVNNRAYVEWALETIPIELSDNYMLRKIIVNYIKQLNHGGSIMVETEQKENGEEKEFIHSIKSNDSEYCLIKTFWQERNN